MCGRFTQTEKKAEALTERFCAILSERTDKQELEGAMGRYNVAPTQAIPAIVAPEGKPELRLLRWGLLPHWAKDRSYGYKTINAKLETVRQKPTYRGLIGKAERHRCLIVADGFYEWQKPEDPKQPRIPWRFTVDGGALFAFAGLWTTAKVEEEWIQSCTLLTCPPNEVVSRIHSRMPVIFPSAEAEGAWLDPGVNAEEAVALCGPFPAERMDGAPANPALNKVGAAKETPELLRPPGG